MSQAEKNIYQRKDGRWEGRYPKGHNEEGRVLYGYLYGKSCAEVKQRMEEFMAGRTAAGRLTFSEVAGQWLSFISLNIKPSTYAQYALLLEMHILPVFKSYPIQDISGVEISSFAREKLETGRKDCNGGLSAKTVRDLLSIIKLIRDYASREQMIADKFSIAYPKLEKKEMRVLASNEQSSLETVLFKEMDICKLGILLCLYTGLRIGELCALRWEDISADFEMLTVKRTLQRIKNVSEDGKKTRILIHTPKSGNSSRDIPLPQFLAPVLRHFVKPGGYYFLSQLDGTFVEPRMMQYHFKKNIKEAGIEAANFHSLRHTFATRCIEAGVDVKSLSEILGHSSIKLTLDRYVHSSYEQKRCCMDKLTEYVGM